MMDQQPAAGCAMNKAKLKDSLGRRFKIRPTPMSVNEYGLGRPLDDTWIVSAVEGDGLRLIGITSSYAPLLSWDHIVQRLSKPVMQPDPHREALLLLKN